MYDDNVTVCSYGHTAQFKLDIREQPICMHI